MIAHYAMDGDQPLTAESAGNTTFYLYGLGGIGEKTTEWNFSLPDGTNTPRQLSDGSGEITLSARYTPWGDTLETYGTGNPSTGSGQAFTFGYFGGVMDAATGLLYVGNGQYYDPVTGRFLTRDVYPNSPNPYVPWNPIGAILGPLGLVALVFGRKRKRGKWDTLIIIVLLGISAGVSIAACAPAPVPNVPAPGTNQPPASPAPTQTPIPTGPVTIPTNTSTPVPSPTNSPTAIPCPMPTQIVEHVNLSAYYTVLEKDYAGGKTPILVTEKNNRRQSVGKYLIRKEELRENVKYTNFESSAQKAKSDFLYDPEGLCFQGSGRLENDLYISCVDPVANITGFDWLPQEKVDNVMKRPLEVVAICPHEHLTPFKQGDVVEIPALKSHLQSFGKDEFLTVTDTGGGLCATDGHSETLDVYMGAGQTAYDAHYLPIRGIDDTTVNIYRGVVP